MFENIGKKFKVVATIIAWLGIIGSLLLGFVILLSDESTILLGFLVIIIGSLSSWLGSFFMYGFGELIDNSKEIKEKLNYNSTSVLKKQPINNDSDLKITAINNGTSVGTCEICDREVVVLRMCKVENTFGCKNLKVCENCINNFAKNPKIANNKEHEIKIEVPLDIVSKEKNLNEKQCLSCGRTIPISQKICKCGCEEFNI